MDRLLTSACENLWKCKNKASFGTFKIFWSKKLSSGVKDKTRKKNAKGAFICAEVCKMGICGQQISFLLFKIFKNPTIENFRRHSAPKSGPLIDFESLFSRAPNQANFEY